MKSKASDLDRKCEHCDTLITSRKKKTVLCPRCANHERHRQYVARHKGKLWYRNCPLCGHTSTFTDYRNRWRAERDSALCRVCSGKRRPRHTQEARRKIRKKFAERIGTYRWRPTYSPKACRLFDEIDKRLKFHGQHAENGGEYLIKELGYWVDYYEPDLNLIIEYDEAHHYTAQGVLKKKDRLRQAEIQNKLNCKFIRVSSTLDIDSAIEYIRGEI